MSPDLECGDVEDVVALAVGGQEGGRHQEHVQNVVITLNEENSRIVSGIIIKLGRAEFFCNEVE